MKIKFFYDSDYPCDAELSLYPEDQELEREVYNSLWQTLEQVLREQEQNIKARKISSFMKKYVDTESYIAIAFYEDHPIEIGNLISRASQDGKLDIYLITKDNKYPIAINPYLVKSIGVMNSFTEEN